MEKKKLRILFVIPYLASGGAEVLLGNICLELSKKGHGVTVVCLEENPTSFKNFPNVHQFLEVAKPKKIEFSIKFSIPNILKVHSTDYIKIIETFKPNVIHSHLFLAELISHSYFKKGISYFSHAHDNMFQLEPLGYKTIQRRKWFHYAERLWLLSKYKKFNNQFVSISNDTSDFLNRALPKGLRKNIHLLNNAIDYYSFERKIKSFNSTKKIRIISVGSLVVKKNHILLLEIAKELIKQKINFEIEVLGGGILMKKLVEKTSEQKLNEYIFFRGNVGNIPEYLAKADIYLHPATYEPFGLVILEAMASGLPVICLNGKGNVGLNVEGKTGFMIDFPNAEKFAGKIIYLMNNPEEYAKISEFCVNFSKDYDIENYCKKLVELYQNAINNKSKLN